MSSTKDVLKSLMKEVNLNSKVQRELLQCANSGKSFPYVPRALTKTKIEIPESPQPLSLKLSSRPLQRPKSTIEKLGNYERDRFRPNPSKTRPPYEKERLQNLMAYGKDIDEELRNLNFEEESNVEEKSPPIDMFAEILREIKERREFLDEMMELGEGKKYLSEIQCQIALRQRELEKINKERAQKVIQKYRI